MARGLPAAATRACGAPRAKQREEERERLTGGPGGGFFYLFLFFLWAVTGPALDTVELSDPDMQTLPEYLSGLTPRIMRLKRCHQKLRDLLSLLPSMPSSAQLEYRAEMDKIKHCGKLVVL